ncbi:uncharacterized protein A4U43_C05F11070 [Asparagus officinalis]|uniref:Uncharacterized protein n=1 Tax=Asparagus officinalis TaxID=4686 RepID=A0A5P1ER30_ASPOF|nr:uncharacterized protein A4U43_C05F11070 [Asparagus officinalis]
MGNKQIHNPVSYQACRNDGHDGSRAHVSDCLSPEENNHTSSEAMVTDNLQDNINVTKRRGELVDVAEDVEKQSLNDNNRKELVVVEVAKDMKKQSINDNTGRELAEVAEDTQNQSTINDHKGKKELVEVSQDVEMHSIPEGSELRLEGAAPIPEATLDYSKVENQVQGHPPQELGDGLRPPSIENLPTKFPDNKTVQSQPTSFLDSKFPQEETSRAGENVLLAESKNEEVSAICVPDPLDTKPSTPSEVQGNNSTLHSVCDSTPVSRSNPQVQVQPNPQTTMLEALPCSVAYSQNPSSSGNWPQMYYVQSSQSQQWQGLPQLNQTGTNVQMTVTQGHTYQPQANQMFGQYQMGTAQVYPVGNFSWSSQSGQQQAYAYVQQQSDAQPQSQFQVNQQSLQSNEQQYRTDLGLGSHNNVSNRVYIRR